MPSLRILSDDDVKSTIDTEVALRIARETLRSQSAGGVALSSPAAMSLDASSAGGSIFKFKGAALGHLQASGIRLIGRNADGSRPSNYCAIFDKGGAALSGLVPENWLSRIRTAAFGVAVAEKLVRPGPLVVSMFGAGAIAREIVPMLVLALPVKELRINSRRAESMNEFSSEMATRTGACVIAEPSRKRMTEGADLIITLTESRSPLVLAGELGAGAVLCSMGGHHEVEYDVLRNADRFVVDDPDYASEAGDGGAWIKQGHLNINSFRARIDALACDVVADKVSGRLTPDDRIVALLQGMAIGDIGFAAHALQAAEKLGRGTVVELP